MGLSVELITPIPYLFSSIGIEVSCISTKKILKMHPSIDKFYLANDMDNLLALAVGLTAKENFKFVISGDDDTIRSILDANLTTSEKERLSPVISSKYFEHLGSKIGLSLALAKSQIPTPQFEVIKNEEDLITRGKNLKFPFMLKGDRSGGGGQTFEITSPQDLKFQANKFSHYPAVIQEKILGDLVSVDAIYLNGNLVHFSYSFVLKCVGNNPFTPSTLREYPEPSSIKAKQFEELAQLGSALGLNGFVNISCIRSAHDGKHYYFEADARPTVWAGISRYFGDDVGSAIQSYLKDQKVLSYPPPVRPEFPLSTKILHFSRASIPDFIVRSAFLWPYFPKDKFIFYYLFKKHVVRKLIGIVNLRFFRKKLALVLPPDWARLIHRQA